MAELFSKLAFFDPFPKKFSVFTNYSGETNSLFVQFLVSGSVSSYPPLQILFPKLAANQYGHLR